MSPCWQYRRHLLERALVAPGGAHDSRTRPTHRHRHRHRHRRIAPSSLYFTATRSRTRRLRLNSTHSLTVRAARGTVQVQTRRLCQPMVAPPVRAKLHMKICQKCLPIGGGPLRAAICMGCRLIRWTCPHLHGHCVCRPLRYRLYTCCVCERERERERREREREREDRERERERERD